jgi:hypothetical protein
MKEMQTCPLIRRPAHETGVSQGQRPILTGLESRRRYHLSAGSLSTAWRGGSHGLQANLAADPGERRP